MICENVIVCGVVKNGDRTIGPNVAYCVKMSELFTKCKIIIYENNSTDSTKEVLNQIKHPNVLVISENINADDIKRNSKIWAYTKVTGSDHPCRIEQIANARNKVLDEINKPDYDEYRYVVWVDLDSAGWNINGIIDSFVNKYAWDIVYANGKDRNRKYYDLYAYRGENQPFGPEIIGEHFWNNLPNIQFNDHYVPVFSAFGGLGIYKKEIFKTIRYDCIVNDEVKRFYRNFLQDKEVHGIVCSEDAKFPGGQTDEVTNIFWKNNSGYDNMVVCEHVCFNLAAINAGYKVCINSKLEYFCSDR
jgi:hypothetical protein